MHILWIHEAISSKNQHCYGKAMNFNSLLNLLGKNMFYAQFVLSKKGPLAKIWLAAHWEKKLSKAQIYETNVQDAVEEILQPKVKMALRTTGHLLLGIVRIYSRKAKYLLADCNEAFLKIKMAFRPGQVEMLEDGKEAPFAAISLPEVYTDFDSTLPEFNEAEFATHLQINQSRIDDITLKEDHISDQHIGVEVQRDVSSFISGDRLALRDVRGATPSLEGAKAPGVNIFADDDFGGMDMGGGEEDMEGGVPETQESFTLEPLEAGALERPQERRRRRRRLIIDEQKNISGEEMKANMADYSDTLQPLDLAPPTRRLMRLKESGTVEKLFHLPGCTFTKAKPLVRLYQSHLVMRARVEEDVVRADEIRRELEMSETIEDELQYGAESTYGEDYEDIGPVPFEPIGAESPTPVVADLRPSPEGSPAKEAEEAFYPPSEKRKRSMEGRPIEEEEAMEGEDGYRWSKRTQNVLNAIVTKIRTTGDAQITLNDLLTKGSTRKTAAQKFYTLLVLKKSQAINVEQHAPYEDIYISAGPNIAQGVPK
ncbi:Rad21 / Rec8 like protein [Teladorsagia circumcincta]|uniref:Rad21 / Rec8 like protein n=1 Tax=Teladorsagia circumcincta TaxID=45464 RepID=A0A2G9UVU5_TELCI|nr:Rad21 / Rec8 like protein [Teladorsagia circumcincta]